MSKKKHTLQTEKGSSLLALGIASTETEFQVSLVLNQMLSIKLTASAPIKQIIKDVPASFNCFSFDNDENLEVKLIINRSGNQSLFPNMAHFDYLLILNGEEAKTFAATALDKFKSEPNISLISEIDIKKSGKLAKLLT